MGIYLSPNISSCTYSASITFCMSVISPIKQVEKTTHKNTTITKQKYKIRRDKSFEGLAGNLRTRVRIRLGQIHILMLELKYWLEYSYFHSKRNMKSLDSLIHLIKKSSGEID